MTVEGKLQAKIVKYARSLGFMVKRNHMGRGAEVGWPDLEILLPGKEWMLDGQIAFIEVKAPGKEVSPIQKHRIYLLRHSGYQVAIIDDYNAAVAILNNWKKRHNVASREETIVRKLTGAEEPPPAPVTPNIYSAARRFQRLVGVV